MSEGRWYRFVANLLSPSKKGCRPTTIVQNFFYIYWIFTEKKRVQFDNKSANWEKDQRTLAASLSNFREKQTAAEVNRMFSQEGEVLQLLRREKKCCVFRDQRTIMLRDGVLDSCLCLFLEEE